MDGDFKRPLGPNNDGVRPADAGGYAGSPETYENAQGQPVEADKSETVADSPAPMKQKSGGAKKWVMRVFVTLLLLGALGAAGWFWYDGQNARTELSDTKLLLNETESQLTATQAELASKDAAPVDSESTTEEKVKTAASNYACNVVVASTNTCDKVSQSVVKSQEQKDTTPGFAIVNVLDANNKVLMHLLLKSNDGMEWVVIFKGDKLDTATIDTFKVPTAFTDLTVQS